MTEQIYFEDVALGHEPARLSKGPLREMHLFRWSAAMENWHRIHYDRRFAQEHDNLPDLLVNGSLKQQFMTQFVRDFAGPQGWAWKIGFQFRGMNVPGETLTAWGRITDKKLVGDYGVVTLEIGLVNEKQAEGTPGTATVVLPRRGGKPVPYPFDPALVA